MTEEERDRFGLPKMSTNQEVAVSFTLFTLGTLLVVSMFYSISSVVDIGPALMGLIMMATGYVFAIESIREFEEKDHFLSRKLMEN
ncbi:MAG: hypothetical protein ABEJ56_02975 [Candidatus Nanohaloarchaea archaeon]